jgi:uncharacterized membrane protein YgdD (TMEM256/DUF423 family)
MLSRFWMIAGALFGLMAVAMSGYAAHGLPADRAALAMTGAQLAAWHGLALLFAGLLAERRHGPLPHLAACCFTLGALGFCGGVWLRALTDHSLGAVTPAGGALLLAGWVLLAIGALARGR